MLTAQQIEARAGKLTASRVAALMQGDTVKIDRLYREMIGEEIEENLDDVWAVQLGEATEELNLRWFERKNGCILERKGHVIVHPAYQWAAATLDGWYEALNCPIETKHVGGREPIEVIIDRYAPQTQWQMWVTGATQCLLSVIMGANPPIVETLLRDEPYVIEMRRRGAQFMECVRERTPPVVLPAVPSPEMAVNIVDMSTNNAWCSRAWEWLNNKDAAKIADDATKVLKNMVPPDAKKVHGGGIQITRDRAGRLSLREESK